MRVGPSCTPSFSGFEPMSAICDLSRTTRNSAFILLLALLRSSLIFQLPTSTVRRRTGSSSFASTTSGTTTYQTSKLLTSLPERHTRSTRIDDRMQGLSRRRLLQKIPSSFSVLLLLVSLLGCVGTVHGFLPSPAAIARASGTWAIFVEGRSKSDDGYDGLGEYDPSEGVRPERETLVGNPQLRVKEKDRSVTSILRELAAIQQQGPQKYCILGTRHCSYMHQQIIELLAYALVLSGNHVYTSGAGGTNAAAIRGALRAEREDLLTVVLPQSMGKQTKESQELLKKVEDVIAMPQNDDMSLDVASRICNSYLLSLTDQLVSFAFHESNTVIEAAKEAKELDMLVTTLFLD